MAGKGSGKLGSSATASCFEALASLVFEKRETARHLFTDCGMVLSPAGLQSCTIHTTDLQQLLHLRLCIVRHDEGCKSWVHSKSISAFPTRYLGLQQESHSNQKFKNWTYIL